MPRGIAKDPELARKRMRSAALSLKQMRFVKEYAHLANGTQAARKAGYSGDSNVLGVTASRDLLGNPKVASAVQAELQRIEPDYSADRVKRRLDELSHGAQAAGQFGPATRCEELLGKAAGMWIDLQLSADLSDNHISALIELAKKRATETVDNRDSDDE